MPVKVEFFGIPRARAGVADTTVEGGTVGNVLEELARRFPRLAQTCIADGKLQAGYTLNLRGQRFVREPETTLSEGDVLLFLSLDAGG